jgi:hypothetical protein
MVRFANSGVIHLPFPWICMKSVSHQLVILLLVILLHDTKILLISTGNFTASRHALATLTTPATMKLLKLHLNTQQKSVNDISLPYQL